MNQYTNIHDYHSRRHQFYHTIDNFWHDLSQMEYALYNTYPIEATDLEEIRLVSNRISQIFSKMASYLRTAHDSVLISLGIPEETLPVIRMQPIGIDSVVSRIDLVKTESGYKMLEMNSDTPTFIVECFKINALICSHFCLENPNDANEGMLAQALRRGIIESAKSIGSRDPNIVFTAHQENREDWNTVSYLRDLSEMKSEICPLSSLTINEEGLFDNRGQKIDVLYRQTYPLEHLIFDCDPETGEKIGLKLLELVKHKKLAILNPPSAFLIQSKALQALIWGIYESDSGERLFTSEELNWIASYMLPTYVEADPFLNHKKFIKKPCYGREGDTVEIFDKNGVSIYKDQQQTYRDELFVFQELVSLPADEIMTEQGPEHLHLLIGSFLIGGKASAIGIRAGRGIINNESYFLPVCLNSYK